MSCEDTYKLCYRWIVEYDCWRMWTQFSQLGSVDGIPNRAGAGSHWQDGVNAGKVGDCDETDRCHLLVFFMRKISDAASEVSADAATQHDVSVKQTTLEDAIDLLDQISRRFTGVLECDELKVVQLCLKRYAVLVPLWKNDRTTAKAVFGRQWNHWKNVDEMRCRNKLATMIENDASPPKQPTSFNKVIVKCQSLLEKIMSSLSKPFLVQVAQQVSENVAAKNADVKSTPELQHSPVKSHSDSLPAKSPAKRASPRDETCVVVVEKMSEKDQQKSVVVNKSPAKQSTQPAAATDSSVDRTKTADNTSHSVILSTSNTDESEITLSDESDADSVDIYDDDWWRPASKASRRGKKRPWSALEEELVFKGAREHGVGNWALIHANYLKDRTNVDIKDKWRNMMKKGRLSELARKFGPLHVN